MNWNQINNGTELENALDEKIRETRVHSFQIHLVSPLGEPVKGVKAHVAHKDHDFAFGVCPNGHISMTNKLACGEGEEAEAYWKRIGDLFNATTLWWGWRVLEPVKGQWTFDKEVKGFGPMERMVERAEKLGHRLTAHALLYPRADLSPEWLAETDGQESFLELEAHVKKTVERYKGRIACWHPVNEGYAELEQVENLKLNEGIVYKWVHEGDLNGTIVDNGGYTIDPDFYEKGIRNAEKFGGRVDALGIRGYFELYDSEAIPFYESIWKHFENLSVRYQKGIRFTEIGATSAPRKGEYNPWDVDYTTAEKLGIGNFDEFRDTKVINEETQAAFLTRMYKLAFAHPGVFECTYWDLCDSYTWNEVEGGLLRPDLSPKPAYEALRRLIHKEWKTEALLETGAEGSCVFEGFDGIYEVTAGDKVYTLHFNKDETEHTICIY